MPINVYTGLMGSGKSYEVVASVIIPAIKLGRRVVTNVDGIDSEAIRAYCVEKSGLDFDNLGHVVHCSNDDVHRPDFFPYGEQVDTLVQPGDLVCIDEAWRFWGTGNKIQKEHGIFFREHRHYVHPISKVSCDLVLMVQDINDLHRTLKVVTELSFRTTKLKSLGLNKNYRLEMWEGYKQLARLRVAIEKMKRYDKEIFPLYSSYSGGTGKELRVDDRQNIFKNPKLWFGATISVLVLSFGLYHSFRYFDPKTHIKPGDKSIAAPLAASSSPVPATSPSNASKAFVSSEWRATGTVTVGSTQHVVLQNGTGRIRLEHPSNFQGAGALLVGQVDGERITTWSGSIAGPQIMPEVKAK